MNIIKNLLKTKYIKKEDEFKKRILRNKINQDKLKNNNEIQKYYYKINNNNNNIVVGNQIELIERKINKNNFSNCRNIELNNSFKSKLFLSISNPYEQLINTRLYGKLINDEEFLKELHNNEKLFIKQSYFY